jgi:hypothetical protein
MSGDAFFCTAIGSVLRVRNMEDRGVPNRPSPVRACASNRISMTRIIEAANHVKETSDVHERRAEYKQLKCWAGNLSTSSLRPSTLAGVEVAEGDKRRYLNHLRNLSVARGVASLRLRAGVGTYRNVSVRVGSSRC